MRNKTKYFSRILTAFLAVMLCVTAFSIPALAYGGDSNNETAEITGGLELETEETDTADAAEGTEADTLNPEEIAALLSSLFGSQVNIAATDEGIQLTSGGEATQSHQTGTVTTGGGRLNVRTGAGLDNTAFTQLTNGTTVEVIGTEGDWIEILLPERIGYVHSDYLTVSDNAPASEGSFSLSIGEDEIAALELFTGTGGSAALTPDGNLTLIDDIGSASGSGKQFITVETKSGNVFYLIIDRDDDGDETVHFLNQVDEADLLALMEDGETAAGTPAVCICTTKCTAGNVNTDCPVCAVNMTECVGKEAVTEEPEPTDDTETEPEAEKSGGAAGGILVILLLAALVGGGAYGYIKFIKNKPKTKTAPDLDDYDFDEDEDEDDALDAEYETDAEDEDSAESEDA